MSPEDRKPDRTSSRGRLPGPAGFEPFEHTADVGLRVWGRTIEELFDQASRGLLSFLVAEPVAVRPGESRTIAVEGHGLEDVLVAWLGEILYLLEVRRFVPASVVMESVDERGARGRIEGETYDRSRHELALDVKAVTYHGLEIRRSPEPGGGERFVVAIVFDV